MKILELRFKNLNSLCGEWRIDFTNPEYVSNGIFALTGPTGAGKSTILDAICLALYGATPRLGKITKSTNEIMSRRTGECYAEVLFESQAGCFRCNWSQHRARKKAEGDLQNPKHEIAEGAENGKIIEHQLRRVATVIEEKTGMDFERFTRSILLAQGGFDTFLKADAEQKSKILEQITGTEIYTEISRRVHERQRSEREQLNLLQAETSGIAILEPEQEAEIQLDLEAKQKQENELASQSTEIGKTITWLTTIEGLKKEINDLTDETAKLQTEIEAFKPERQQLELAMKAASLNGTYATLSAVRKQQVDDTNALAIQTQALPQLEATVSEQTTVLNRAEQQTRQAKDALQVAAPLIQQIRSIDQTLADQQQAISVMEQNCRKDATQIAEATKQQRNEQKKRGDATKTLETVTLYLHQNASDEWLIGGLAGIEEQLSNLLAREQEITRKKGDIKKAQTALAQAVTKLDASTRQCVTRSQEIDNASIKLRQGQEQLQELLGGKLLREYRTEKEALLREMAYLARIAELEEHRTKLEDGKACPLCGATEHPYAVGNIPTLDATEHKISALTKLINQAETRETANKKLEQAETTAKENLAASEKLQAIAANDKNTTENTLALLQSDLEQLQVEFSELQQLVGSKLQSLGITEIADNQVADLLVALQKRLHNWQAHVSKQIGIEKQIATIDGEITRLDAVITTHKLTLTDKQSNLNLLKKEYVTGSEQRKELYGDKNTAVEEKRLNLAITDAETTEVNLRATNTQLQQQLTMATANIASLSKQIEQRVAELQEIEAHFLSALETIGFVDENQFLAARLTIEQQNILSAKAKQLDDNQTALNARKTDRETRLNVELARQITDKSLDELQPQFVELEESLKQLRDVVASLKYTLSENLIAKERIKDKQAAIDAQKQECLRWDKLHGLIGSADGKKYRNFAQGLTFELMVAHANRQLAKMTDRYLLIRDNEQPLELNVIDNYQAGEIRSTKNLSGGESFIVSLTLALGLSKMASRKVRVDSLFLDEGFGTLDEEALETALETLSGLQQNGKLIGIISHVSALKERISTQISIVPVSGGKSTVNGPGCNRTIN